MCGSHSATTVPRSLPPAPTNETTGTTRHAIRSHPHPSPSQTGSRAASSPPRAGRNFFGKPLKLQNRARTAQVPPVDPRNLFTGCFEKKGPSRQLVPPISQERAHHFAPTRRRQAQERASGRVAAGDLIATQ